MVGSVADRTDSGDRMPGVPDQSDAPVVWDPARRTFVDAPVHEQVEPPPPPRSGPARDERRFYVPAGTTTAPPRTSAPAGTAAAGAGGAERRRGGPPPAEEGGAGAPPGSAGGARSTAPPTPPPPRKRRRIKRRTIVIVAILLPVLLVAAGLLWAQLTFNKIDKVAVGDLLDTGGAGTNYLIVGSDSRAGVDPNDPNAGAIVGEGAPGGQRSDTMLVLRIQGGQGTMLSVPRDLYVTVAETGQQGRINSAYNGGPGRLIQTVKQNLNIPIHRYIEVDFVTFAKLVDAIGGVTIDFPYPAFDDHSGLDVPVAGPVELDGTQALAYVRSRHFTQIIDGEPQTDPTGDIGRVMRQQQFLRAVLSKAGGSRNPITLMKVANSLVGGLRIDDRMSMFAAMRFAWRMGRLDPQSVALPVDGKTIGGAAVLVMREGEAEAVLAGFR